MTVFKHPRGKSFRYDFWWKGHRYTGSTDQVTQADAELVEHQIKLRLRQDAHGIAPFDRMQTPSFTAWAEVHLAHVTKKRRVTRLDQYEQTLRLVLQFWGRRPARQPDLSSVPAQWRYKVEAAQMRAAAAPYHDLRLADPVLEPKWIEDFEDWMATLGIGGLRKNHYRSMMSGLYRTALLPAYRKQTNVTTNPFLHIEREPKHPRRRTITREQLRAWMTAAAPHLCLAMAIAAYAPELRRGSILGLRWKDHLDRDLTRIVVPQHKTARITGEPQVIPVDPELQAILRWARSNNPRAVHVVSYDDVQHRRKGRLRADGVQRPETGLRNAIARANEVLPPDEQMTYGVRGGGITFHTIRHTMATFMAEWGLPEKIRQMVIGHKSLTTTQDYTHMAAHVKRAPLAQISSHLKLVEVVEGRVQGPPIRTRRKR